MSDGPDEAVRGDGPRPAPFRVLPSGFGRTLAAWSATSPVAYVEADIRGGTGDRSAAVRTAGALTFGPLFEPGRRPISPALRHLGGHADGRRDEFDAIGPGRHGRTEDRLKDD
ncbi:hypothetical protein [Kitasatospora sp. CB02891]|uniref:hypothetical protein n=1 Tax=Kitasatospora sp. CB02891 TaxID=2020329 RepID=UPI000CB57D68|nr:hypothetical protein [Kitasatospora sp. CB02891]PJN21619.1 hypothetical protein CG736_32155 [Kitasatospora sp. CB02891]